MKTAVPFRRWHYAWLTARIAAADTGGGVRLSPLVLAQLEAENTWTGVVDNEPIICAGTVQQWAGRHIAWAYLGVDTAPHMLWITREVQSRLALVKGRIELTVRHGFTPGCKWAEMLGFHIETPRLIGFGPSGEDHIGYVRFNGKEL